MKIDNKKEKSKQAYEKPMLRTIELAAEEVLAVGCKTTSSPAFGSFPCAARPCSAAGS